MKIASILILCFGIASFSMLNQESEAIVVSSSLLPPNSTGKQLAQQYCGSCHLFPEPSLLDKKTWVDKVLPNMGLRMGVRPKGTNPYTDIIPTERPYLYSLSVYPDSAILPLEDWEKIIAYYQNEAPIEPLPQKPHAAIAEKLPFFQPSFVNVADYPIPKTTLIKFDKTNDLLYVGDAQNTLFVLNKNLHVQDKWWIDSEASDINFRQNKAPLLLTLGIFNPSDQRKGRLMSLQKGTQNTSEQIDIQEIPRPVHVSVADLNLDGKEDVVINAFGNHYGKLFWLDHFDQEQEHILKELPGARKTEIFDFNKDKKPDIIAMMTQAREEISIFYNQGNGNFNEKVLLQFPPCFGLSYFELLDFNKDGHQDLLVTNGDNWDLSPINKNYHGVRLYQNDGNDRFKEIWFYPLYGAAKAIARDFDLDGDLDIAAISFYNDLKNPSNGFVYFSNEGGLKFKPSSTPEAAHGKWMVMDAADYDGDGDQDLVLGSYFQTIGEVTKLTFLGIQSFPQLLVLTNGTKK